MPSHHGSPCEVTAVFVKIVFSRIADITFGLVFSFVPGATPKNPASGIDGVQIAVRSDLHPGDIVAHGPHAIAFIFERGNHHGQIRFSARARECRRHVGHFPGGRFQSQDQHVFGHPALFARHPACDPQGKTFFPQQRVAAVAGADAPNQFFFGEMSDVTVARFQVSQRMESRNKIR